MIQMEFVLNYLVPFALLFLLINRQSNIVLTRLDINFLVLILILLIINVTELIIKDTVSFELLMKSIWIILTMIMIKNYFDNYPFILKYHSLLVFLGVLVYLNLSNSFVYYDAINLRFGMNIFGSPNSTAFVLAVTIVSTVNELFFHKQKRIYFNLLILFVLAYALFLTQSRGGLVIVMIGISLLLYSKLSKMKMMVALLCMMFLYVILSEIDPRYDLIQDFIDTGGTGRWLIWSTLIGDYLNAFPSLNFFFGFGGDAIAVSISEEDRLVINAHSAVIETIYTFGLVGSIFILYLVFLLINNGIRSNIPLVKSICSMLVVSVFVDAYFFDFHLLYFHALLLSIAFANNNKLPFRN